ncbi:MAG: DUF1801 domain-containing protein [Acidobacteria bacterium]|nr:DUF1801 domain-containing protein [Acidobacteriota bacterium]
MQSRAHTVDAYLAELPPERRAALEAVRAVFKAHLDPRIVEGMQYGMIGYAVPHSVYPPGYHCDPRQPLPYAGLAAQKNHLSLYLMCFYAEGEFQQWFREAWARTGKKLDMGKVCIRFKKAEDLALEVLAEALRRVSPETFISFYEAGLKSSRPRKARSSSRPR